MLVATLEDLFNSGVEHSSSDWPMTLWIFPIEVLESRMICENPSSAAATLTVTGIEPALVPLVTASLLADPFTSFLLVDVDLEVFSSEVAEVEVVFEDSLCILMDLVEAFELLLCFLEVWVVVELLCLTNPLLKAWVRDMVCPS